MATKNNRRIEALERKAQESGLFDSKVDVTRYFQVLHDAYGIPGEVEPVFRRSCEWQRLVDTILTVYG